MTLPRFSTLTAALERVVVAVSLMAATSGFDMGLTPSETSWLKAAWPVIGPARAAGMPLDIVVQPQQADGEAPVALAYIDGRCKLVLTMRGNPEAPASLERMAKAFKAAGVDVAEATTAAIQLTAAHEIHGHCARHLAGSWEQVPPGYAMAPPEQLRADLRQAWVQMRTTRLEEGFADLSGLDWVRQQQPQLYPVLHAWLLDERTRDLIPGSHHDTLAWIRAADPHLASHTADWAVKTIWLRVLSQEH